MADFNAIRFQPSRPLLKEVSAERLNAILTEIKRNKPVGERGITVRQSGDRTYIGLAAKMTGGTGGGIQFHPFQISSSTAPESENQYVVTVRPGTLNNLMPTNLFEENALRQFPIPSNELNYVILTGQTNASDQFVSCALSVSETPPSAQEPTMFSLPVEAEFLLGVVYNGTAYNTITDSLLVSGVQQFTEQKTSPAAGALPYNIYYVWA
jgi:hypothetical protein